MSRITGIGGIFFKANDAQALAEWYQTHLGIEFGGQTYADFPFAEKEKGSTVFSFFAADSKHFAPSEKQFMINLRVENLAELLQTLRAADIEVLDETDSGDYGYFASILDPEGNKIELWEPK